MEASAILAEAYHNRHLDMDKRIVLIHIKRRLEEVNLTEDEKSRVFESAHVLLNLEYKDETHSITH